MDQQQRHYRGLTDQEVAESRALHGANVLTPPAKTPLWKRFLEKFEDPLIAILLVAGCLSIGISLYEYFGLGEGASVFFEPVGIVAAILLATGLAFIFEVKADREFAILNKVNDDEPVAVIRNGNATEVPRRDIVVGDIIMVSAGQEIAADGELLEASSLTVDESTLTGEPLCHKSVREEDFDKEATFPTNCLMKGTKAMEGHGIMRATAVGDATENGKVFEAAQIDDSVKTPLNEQLDGLGKLITKLSYTIAALIIAGRTWMYLSENAFEWLPFVGYELKTLMIAVSLIVVSVPEGLPMAVTLSLAYSMRRMLKTNNLVRKLHACETMGAATVICTDKTGTLTRNQMRVAQADFFGVSPGSPEMAAVAEGIAVNSTASLDLSAPSAPKVIGNPTEGALMLWLHDSGFDYATLREKAETVAEVPFSTERKYMATAVKSAALGGDVVLHIKGAPEILMGMSARIAGGRTGESIAEALAGYQSQGMRTLGFARQVMARGTGIEDGAVVAGDIEFIGVAAIADPVRDEVPAAVRECINAGIDIKIVTGDTPGTAKEIGRQIGLWQKTDTETSIISGPDFAALTDEEMDARVKGIKIISRARPMDKKRLVESLQRLGEVVSVTGDGTNDAPALKAAHVGLSMGDGTSVAKEASDITIVDNSFQSIGRAVMWGRSLYHNIQRFILFQLTVNVAACLTVLAGAFLGTESPLTVTQMLWVNLIMDTFAAMALASLPPTAGVMAEKPRKRTDFIITKPMGWTIGVVGGLFFALLMALYYVMAHADISSLADLPAVTIGGKDGLSEYELSLFFTTFVMLQFWNMFNARAFYTGRSAFHFAGCSEFVTIAAVILLGQVAIVHLGGEMFNVVPLTPKDWAIVILGTSPVLLIGELARLLPQHKH